MKSSVGEIVLYRNHTKESEHIMAKSNKAVIVTVKAQSKADIARGIFADVMGMAEMPKRKVVLERIASATGLSMAASSTYLQNAKRAAGFLA
jgi:hypothetical protein